MTENNRVVTKIRTTSIKQCPVCGSEKSRVVATCEDRWYGTPSSWPYHQCSMKGCHHVWLALRPAAEDIPTIYRNYYTSVPPRRAAGLDAGFRKRLWPSPLSAHREAIRRKNPLGRLGLDNARVLEVGAGSGAESRAMAQAGYEVTAQDIDPNLEQLDHIGPLENLGPAGSFDALYSSHQLEHVADLHDELRQWQRLLTDNGQILVRTPNHTSLARSLFRNRWRGYEAPRHFHIFTPTSLKRLLVDAGFSTAQIHHVGTGGGRSFASSVVGSERGLASVRAIATVSGQLIEDVLSVAAPHLQWELIAVVNQDG